MINTIKIQDYELQFYKILLMRLARSWSLKEKLISTQIKNGSGLTE